MRDAFCIAGTFKIFYVNCVELSFSSNSGLTSSEFRIDAKLPLILLAQHVCANTSKWTLIVSTGIFFPHYSGILATSLASPFQIRMMPFDIVWRVLLSGWLFLDVAHFLSQRKLIFNNVDFIVVWFSHFLYISTIFCVNLIPRECLG